jgi:hypothetical protein
MKHTSDLLYRVVVEMWTSDVREVTVNPLQEFELVTNTGTVVSNQTQHQPDASLPLTFLIL